MYNDHFDNLKSIKSHSQFWSVFYPMNSKDKKNRNKNTISLFDVWFCLFHR